MPRGVREEVAPKGEADPGDPVNPYPSDTRDRPVAEKPGDVETCLRETTPPASDGGPASFFRRKPIEREPHGARPPQGVRVPGGCTGPSANL